MKSMPHLTNGRASKGSGCKGATCCFSFWYAAIWHVGHSANNVLVTFHIPCQQALDFRYLSTVSVPKWPFPRCVLSTTSARLHHLPKPCFGTVV
jgi:hypothetical protein